MSIPSDEVFMRRALDLARKGQGHVEPNPMVGCVVLESGEIVAEGFHEAFGGPHAERAAAANAADPQRLARGTWYITLEPCCHHGKTPPCTDLLLRFKPPRVVVAMRDPFPAVSGGGVAQLSAAGIDVLVGVCEMEARRLNAPYLKRVVHNRPWVIAKWAMTLDGKIATASGQSRWISGEESRRHVHRVRGRMDAIIIGNRTLSADDPLLTARPPGPRTPRRIILATQGRLDRTRRLVQTVAEAPVMVACGPEAAQENVAALRNLGCEVVQSRSPERTAQIADLLDHLYQQEATNVLVEGGGEVLASFLATGEIDEYHVYVAPKIVGGKTAPGPIGGVGLASLADSPQLEPLSCKMLGNDCLITTRRRAAADGSM